MAGQSESGTPSVLGVDVGGTFTDFLLLEGHRVAVYKRPSTLDDPARAVLEGLREMGARPDQVAHGSTVATNAIIERKGARTALITTGGFRDVLVIGRQTRPKLYDLSPRRPPPLVPDELRLEADERLDCEGNVLRPLDPSQVERLLDEVEAQGAESLAICFLFSFLNRDHERLIAEAARRRRLLVSPSHEVLPEHREYERTATTVANAYVGPIVSRYLSRLESELREQGVGSLRVMASSGGSMSPQAAARLAVRTALSGPAGGVAGAFRIASAAGFDHVITLDMGGTSTDVSLCPGRIGERDESVVGGELPLRGPSVDVLSVGAGGGSIARIDAGGALRVGPESAGADPGPAFYGRSRDPTVTDAHVVLGRITPEHFLGGRMEVRPDLSRAAIARLAEAYNGDATAAAAAVLRVANASMERALRVVSVERGHDPSAAGGFTLVAFGGAGPLHACDLAASLRMRRVLVPLYPGVLSALGIAAAPVAKDVSAPAMLPVAADGDGWPEAERTLSRLSSDLERRGVRELRDEALPSSDITVQRFLEMRYAGQSYELSVPADSFAPASFLPRFHDLHQERYSHSDPARPTEVVNLRARLTLATPALAMPPIQPSGEDPLLGQREVWFDAPTRAAVYDRSRLSPGDRIEGPAIIVQMDATTAVPPTWRGVVDTFGNLILERGQP
jgi:N-methylhydantoinase A